MSQILDVAIGLALTFFLFSMLVSALQELLAATLNWRGRGWEEAMQQWLDGGVRSYRIGWLRNKIRRARRQDLPNLSVAHAVLNHGAVSNLMNGERLPSYAPGESIADALIDVLRKSANDPAATMEGLSWAVQRLPNDALRNQLQPIVQAAGDDIAAFRDGLIRAYGDVMDRVSGWYRRYSQKVQIALGLLVAIVFNVDAIHIGSVLVADDTQRKALVEAAAAIVNEEQNQAAKAAPADGSSEGQTTGATEDVQALSADDVRLSDLKSKYQDVETRYNTITQLDLPIGWPYRPGQEWWLALLGWILTAVALSQGAPFWFDLMSTLVRVRGTGKKPEPSTAAKLAIAKAPVAGACTTPCPTTKQSEQIRPNAFETELLSPDDIARLQARLGIVVSHVIDPATRQALRQFQRSVGATADGQFNVSIVQRLVPELFS